MHTSLPKIIVICGPTASGKTALALDLAKKFSGEIVVADSRQLFKDMSIGTNAPTSDEITQAPHHLHNFLSPNKKFNVSEFKVRAEEVIDEISKRHHLPIIVGGTGLYIKALVDNFDFTKTPENVTLRTELAKLSLEQLLEKVDALPESTLSPTDRKNARRVIRALEIAESGNAKKNTSSPRYHTLQIAPKVEREELYNRINARVLRMIQSGLEQEVRSLIEKYSWDAQAMSGIGYREFRPYFEGETTLSEVIGEIQKDTRRYAKRQLTWFRADKRIHFVANKKSAEKLVADFLAATDF